MNKVTQLNIGQTFIFKGQLDNGQDFSSDEIKSWKVISFFPKLNTKICDLQSLKMIELSNQYPHVKFISVSMDNINQTESWCQKHNVDNLFFVSDYQYQDFAKQTSLWFDKKHTMLKRGLILIDEDNKIIALAINDNIREEPNYDLIIQKIS